MAPGSPSVNSVLPSRPWLAAMRPEAAREDVSGGAIVALQANDARAGEILLEAQDVVDLGAAPAVDRLVVVADAADVGRALGQQAQPQVLGDVGVLVLVDENELEAALVVGEHVRVVEEQPQVLEQQIAEVAGVQLLQAPLIGGIELRALAGRKAEGFARRHLVGRQSAVLPAIDERSQLPRRPAVLVEALRFDHLLQEADLVVGIEDGEARLEADELGVAAQDLDADGVEGAEPRHALDGAADEIADALLHLARRLVGEGDGEDLAGEGAARGEDVGDARRQHARLAGAGAGEHEHGAVERFDGRALLRVEAIEIGRGRVGAGAEPCSARAEIGCRTGAGRQIERRLVGCGTGRARCGGSGAGLRQIERRLVRVAVRRRVRQMFSALHHRFRTIAPGA